MEISKKRSARSILSARNLTFSLASVLLLSLSAILGMSGCSGLVTGKVQTQGVGALSASPSILAFGDVEVGTSATQTLTFSNSGSASVTISQATVTGAEYALSGQTFPLTLPGGQSSSLKLQFTPTVAGSGSGTVSLVSNSPNSPTNVSLTGNGVKHQLSITPSTVNFGNVSVGTTSNQTVVLTNTGTASLSISQATVAGAGLSMSGLTFPLALAPGQSSNLVVQFAPTAAGASSGSLSVTSNAHNSPTVASVTGSGMQQASGQLSANPSSINFGSVLLGSSGSQTIIVTNSGTASVTISQGIASGAGFSVAGLSTPLTLNAGQNASFTATFSPASAGGASGNISITSNAPGSPLVIPLSGTGTASTLLLGANPSSLSFGNVTVGQNSTSSVTLKNNGNSNVTISSVVPTGAGFSASGVAAGTILIPNQSATLNVTFGPTAAGSVTGSIAVASNATNSPATIALSGTGVQQSASFPAWVMSSLNRVGKTDPPGTTSSIALSSARGETVDSQIIVQAPAGGLSNVNLSASSLTGPGGASIPASNITLYREYYITVTGTASYGGGSNPPLGSGTYPEPLIPFNDPETGASLCGTTAVLKACNASLSAGQNQPYWIDISVPHGATIAPPGTYTGSISITADQGTATIPVSLTVWNFGLPQQPSELSLWTLWPPASGNTSATLAQALMRHKVMGWYDPASNAPSDITNAGLNRSGLDSYYFIGIQCNGSYSSLPSTTQINAAAANFPAGLGLDFYLADELNGCTADYGPIRTMGANAHAANRSVKTMLTINAVDPNLYGSIDHWVLLDSVQQWPALPFTAGGDLWSYTSCNAGYGNTPEWMIDYPPINERIQAGFLNWTQGATGILYYRADGWTAGNAIGSWNNVDTTACGGGLGRPGDGIFLYPPAPIASTESAPGIRLKAIRDGIQDYEYAQILKNLGQVSFLNPIVLPIATSWTNWNHSPSALEAVRLQLGQQLNLLAPAGF